MDFPKEGKLSRGLFGVILINIHALRFTGTVGLTRGELKKVISFENGRPVSSRSNVVSESLGGMLVSKGRISQKEMEDMLLEHKSRPQIHIGELLVEKRWVTNLELDDLIKEQLAQRVKQSLFWDTGDYKIVEGKIAEKSVISLGKSLPEIIYEASKEAQHFSYVEGILTVDLKPVKAGGNLVKLEEIRPSGKELAIYRLIDGRNSIGEIAAASKAQPQTVIGFIFALMQLGLVNVSLQRENKTGKETQAKDNEAAEPKKTQADISEASRALLENIRAKRSAIEGKNYFEYFGLDENADTQQIKTEYFNFAKTNHPDRLPKDFTSEMRKEGEALFSKITDAYNIITDESKRSQYIEKIRLEAQGIKQAPSQIIESEIEYQKGNILLKKGDFGGAVEHYKRAIALYPEEAEYFIALGWVLFRKGAKLKDDSLICKGKAEIEKGIKIRPESDHAYLNLGHIAKFEKSPERAKNYYSKALEINPSNLEASSELRLLGAREGNGKKAGIKGFFNSKK